MTCTTLDLTTWRLLHYKVWRAIIALLSECGPGITLPAVTAIHVLDDLLPWSGSTLPCREEPLESLFRPETLQLFTHAQDEL